MSKSLEIKVGQRFGRWTVVEPWIRTKAGEGRQARYTLYYPCRCDCGTERRVRAFKLLSNSRSCGCDKIEKFAAKSLIHGENVGGKKSRIYSIYATMIQRCHNPKNSAYHGYGARGVAVCVEWRNSFVVFRDWAMSHGYRDNLEIDRIENSQGYSPDNCRWSTSAEQKRNTSRTRLVIAFGETKCLTDWALDERCSITPTNIQHRIGKLGWDPEKAITTPRLTRKKSGKFAGNHTSTGRR